jgi:hypothetical protein
MAKHELLGKRFGHWLVVAFFGRPPETNFPKVRPSTWLVRCEGNGGRCGEEKIVRGYSLLRGTSRSCGCRGIAKKEKVPKIPQPRRARAPRSQETREKQRKAATTHGFHRTPTYVSWCAMKDRCTRPKNKSWKDYGGRGIRVCERWLNSFENFLADVGPRPEGKTKDGKALYSIDRFPNNDGDYEPGNVRWATRDQQKANQRKRSSRNSFGIVS